MNKTEEQNEKKLSVKWNENQLKVWKQKKKRRERENKNCQYQECKEEYYYRFYHHLKSTGPLGVTLYKLFQ